MSLFLVKNHGIDLEFVDKVFAETRRFFALPLDEKLKIRQNEHDRGYVPPKAERLDVTAKCADTKERINFGLEVTPASQQLLTVIRTWKGYCRSGVPTSGQMRHSSRISSPPWSPISIKFTNWQATGEIKDSP